MKKIFRKFAGLDIAKNEEIEENEEEMEIYGFDFPIINYQGYFVKISGGEGEWRLDQ